MRSRLLDLGEVADILHISREQVRQLVRSKDLPGFQIDRRGQWRVDPERLQQWIDRKHDETAASSPDVVAYDNAHRA